jgi:serine/threonine protein kinase
MFELFAGQLPFKGVHETAVSYEIVNVDSPPMSSIRPEISPELDAVVLDCLEKDPKERTQAASQVAVELKRYRRESSRQRASRITAARPGQQVSGGQPALQAQAGEPSDAPRAARGVRPTLVVVAVAAIALIAGLALGRLLFSQRQDFSAVRSVVRLPHGMEVNSTREGHSVLSPDGRNLAFSGIDSVRDRALWLWDLRSESPTQLPGTRARPQSRENRCPWLPPSISSRRGRKEISRSRRTASSSTAAALRKPWGSICGSTERGERRPS